MSKFTIRDWRALQEALEEYDRQRDGVWFLPPWTHAMAAAARRDLDRWQVCDTEGCEDGKVGPIATDQDTWRYDDCSACGGTGLKPNLESLEADVEQAGAGKAWEGATNTDEVQDLIYDQHAHVVDVSKMEPVWIMARSVRAFDKEPT
jgi:hypothetical protein